MSGEPGRAARGASLCGAAFAAALMLSATDAAGAQDAATGSAPPPLWERAAYKTLTFLALDNLADGVLFAAVAGAAAGTSGIFLVANAATTPLLYYPYEMAWTTLAPGSSTTSPDTLAVKTVGYQVLTGARKIALSYALTGALLPSLGFAATAFAWDALIYAANDVTWDLYQPPPAASAALVHPDTM